MNHSPSHRFPASVSRTLRHLLALSSLVLLGACEAQKPASVTQASTAPQYSEPALIGKIIDAETKRPIQGAFVYGHYATSQGSIGGGSKFGEHVKSFAVETDANGQFKLGAWSTGDRKIGGQANGKFPMIAIYKPGYTLDIQNLNSISQWTAMSSNGASKSSVTERGIDWTQFPYELAPTKTEKDRYAALSNAGYPMMMVGECGWELYSGLLMATHVEWMRWYKANLPQEFLTAQGYPKPTYPISRIAAYGAPVPTAFDELLSRFQATKNGWLCTDPNTLLLGNKK
jgi:hypothetical protein